jgi:23S rRNA pseudouridine2605 synthase
LRLAKHLAHCGVASRRSAEGIVAAGRVNIDGVVVRDPAHGVTGTEEIRVDGTPVTAERAEVWVVNKPAGVVSTAREPGRRRAVVELVPSTARLYPVGRLDADSTGLLLLTNDGELANRLTHPRYEVPKTYVADLRRPPSERDIRSLAEGVRLEDGITAPARVERVSERRLRLTLREGRNRQIRRMAEAIGNSVDSLERVSFGSLQLGDLSSGEARRLSEAETAALWEDSRRGESG